MLEVNGIPPTLNGHECEGLICQQYWYHGKLIQEVDVLSIKCKGRWHALYFENGTIYWRRENDAPTPYEEKEGDLFQYPHIDLGERFAIKHRIIDDCVGESLPNGARVVFTFERGDRLVVSSLDNQSRIQFIKSGR